MPERQAAWLADPSDQNRGFMSWEGITAAGQRPDSHRDFAAFSGPQKRGGDEYIGAQEWWVDADFAVLATHHPLRSTRHSATFGWVEQFLRPIERRVLALRASGQTTAEIARRFKRGEDHIERIIGWTDIPRQPRERRDGLRPVERRVLALRNDGLSHEEIGVLFRRDAEFVRRVESIAQMRDDLGLLSDT